MFPGAASVSLPTFLNANSLIHKSSHIALLAFLENNLPTLVLLYTRRCSCSRKFEVSYWAAGFPGLYFTLGQSGSLTATSRNDYAQSVASDGEFSMKLSVSRVVLWLSMAYADVPFHYRPHHREVLNCDEAAFLTPCSLPASFTNNESMSSEVTSSKLSSTLALGTDVGAAVPTSVALGTTVFAGEHVVDKAPDVATERRAVECCVILTHVVEHFVNSLATGAAIELSAV
jgi:hypothetical protein